jgi:hypothetical protein
MIYNVLRIFLVHHWMLAIVRGLCTISLGITARTLLGYLVYGRDYYQWISDVSMAKSTAVSLLCVTLSIFFLSLVVDKILIERFIDLKNNHDRPQAA